MDGETRAAQFGDGIAKFRALADTLDPAGKFRASLTLPFLLCCLLLTRAMACAGNAWARESMFAEGEWSAAHLRA